MIKTKLFLANLRSGIGKWEILKNQNGKRILMDMLNIPNHFLFTKTFAKKYELNDDFYAWNKVLKNFKPIRIIKNGAEIAIFAKKSLNCKIREFITCYKYNRSNLNDFSDFFELFVGPEINRSNV